MLDTFTNEITGSALSKRAVYPTDNQIIECFNSWIKAKTVCDYQYLKIDSFE